MRMTCAAVQGCEHGGACGGQSERGQRKIGRVEDRDDEDGAEIVDDGEGQQEDFECRRNARPQHGHHADREGDVGGRGNGPSAHGEAVAPVDGGVDDGGHDHAAQGRDGGKGGGFCRLQRPHKHLAFDFEADEEEEDHHQAVVDPVQQRLGQRGGWNAQRELGVQRMIVGGAPGRIRHDECQDCCDAQDDAAGSFVLQKAEYGNGASGATSSWPCGSHLQRLDYVAMRKNAIKAGS